jgi:hypothetical protein
VDDEPAGERMSGLAIAGVVLTAVLALTWFYVSWQVLKSPLTDAVGETVGSLAAVLLIVSIVGAIRRR